MRAEMGIGVLLLKQGELSFEEAVFTLQFLHLGRFGLAGPGSVVECYLRFRGFPGLFDPLKLLGAQVERVFKVGVLFPEITLNTLDAVSERRKDPFDLLGGQEEVAAETWPKEDVSNDFLRRQIAIDEGVVVGPVGPAHG